MTRRFLLENLKSVEWPARVDLQSIVAELYKARIMADYTPSQNIGDADARMAISQLTTLLQKV